MRFIFSSHIYTKEALLKAAYNYTDKAYIHLDYIDNNYVVDLEMKDEESLISEKEFQNELIAQMIRKIIRNETKNIRELMIARAFASTVIEEDSVIDEVISSEENVDINDILKDWFEETNE